MMRRWCGGKENATFQAFPRYNHPTQDDTITQQYFEQHTSFDHGRVLDIPRDVLIGGAWNDWKTAHPQLAEYLQTGMVKGDGKQVVASALTLTQGQDSSASVLLTVEACVAVAPLLTPFKIKQLIEPTMTQLMEDKGWTVRYVVATYFTQLQEAVGAELSVSWLLPSLVNLLRDPEPEVRAAMATKINDFIDNLPPAGWDALHGSGLVLALRGLFTDTSDHVRTALRSLNAARENGQQERVWEVPFWSIQGQKATQQQALYAQVYEQSVPGSHSLYVANLPFDVSEADVRHMFSKFGNIQEIRNFVNQGYAFVRLDSKEAACNAICKVNSSEHNGQMIRCSWGRANESCDADDGDSADSDQNRDANAASDCSIDFDTLSMIVNCSGDPV